MGDGLPGGGCASQRVVGGLRGSLRCDNVPRGCQAHTAAAHVRQRHQNGRVIVASSLIHDILISCNRRRAHTLICVPRRSRSVHEVRASDFFFEGPTGGHLTRLGCRLGQRRAHRHRDSSMGGKNKRSSGAKPQGMAPPPSKQTEDEMPAKVEEDNNVAPAKAEEEVAPTKAEEQVAPTTAAEEVVPTTTDMKVAPTTAEEEVAPTTAEEAARLTPSRC